jgi:hypothetical protein
VGNLSGVSGRVTPPEDLHGVVVIDPADAVVDVTFEAVAGSRLRILARAEQIPQHVAPQIQGLVDPQGAAVQIPGMRPAKPGPGVRTDTIGPLALSGTYRLRLAGDGNVTGPVFWRVRVTPPDKPVFVLY